MADKVKIGTMWFGGCSGCHLSIADFHESLIDVMEFADFEFSPVLMDTKYDEVPELDILIVEGGIRNDENRELSEMLNEKANMVIAYGTCSCYGGIPGLGNLWTVEELEEEAYINSVSTVNPEGIIPHEDVPHLESRVRPITETMDIDLMIPGCPPRSEDKQQFNQINIDKSKLVLASGRTDTHDSKLDTKPVGFLKDAMKRFARNKASVVATVIICFLVVYAIIGPWISNYDFDYRNKDKAFQLPYIKGLEWLGFDGCKERELQEINYYKYLAMGQESGVTPIVSVKEIKEVNDPNRPTVVKKIYVCKFNTYYTNGIITKNLTKEAFLKLQEYQNDTGIQVCFPAIEETRQSQVNRYDANYWYKTDRKGMPEFDDEGNFQNVYVPYAGSDYYNSLMIEGETQQYEYAKLRASASANGVSYDVRVNEYLYDQYLNAEWVEDDNGGHFEPGPEPVFWFGTNQYGEDIFTRLAYGARFSFILAICVSAINMTIGAIYGAIEGYYGGATDMIMERVSDIVSSIPMYVVISLLKWYVIPHIKGGGGVVLSLLLAFFVTGWIGMAGSVRRQFYRFKNQEFVYAARTLGASDRRLMFKHIFPNSLGTLVTSSVLVIPSVIFSESSLSYLGIINLDVGTITSVGTMLANGQAAGISAYPHIILWPALFIALLMISFNLFGNGLRDAFNPSLRGSEA